jgi:EAL domain-containing protein (putative c-di-GMP-specific phosphodiesterase class I)
MGRSFLLSVNISPRQFQQRRLVKTIEDALKSSGLSARNLEIEITENTLMINSTANLEMLQVIRDLGVRLSIDDFGTGFSSFSYLLQYQIDRLKIDQTFVRQAMVDPNAAAVVRTIIAMSHGLDIKVIAEGAETREQIEFLLRRRCDEVQGYYFARPVGSNELVETIERIEAMDIEEIAAGLGVGGELPPTGAEAFQELDEVSDLPLGSA